MDELARLIPYIKRYPRPMVIGMIALVFGKLAAVLTPQVLEATVDDLTVSVTVEKLAFYAALIVGIALAEGFFRFWMRRLLIGVSRHVEYDLRHDFAAQLQRMPASFYSRWRTGDLMSRASNDMSAVRMVLGPGIMYPAETGIVTIGALAFMFSISWELTLVSLLALPLVSIVVKKFGAVIHKRFEAVQEKMSDLSALAQENLAGMRVVKAYTQETDQTERFDRENEDYFQRNMGLVRIWGAFYPLMTALIGLATALVLWWGGVLVVRGAITLGELVAFFAYLAMLTWPMIAFGWVINIYQRGAASMKRLLSVLDAAPELPDPEWPAGEKPPVFAGRVQFRNVSFRYPVTATNGGSASTSRGGKTNGQSSEQDAVLNDINLEIAPGETVAFVGRTGSGKSTLTRLVARLYDVTEGAVLVDGVDVRSLPLATLRSAIGFVPQESFLFSETIRENLSLGKPEATDAEIREAARIAGLDGDVDAFPDGYDTLVGERGITLSGGQRQRATIARALLVDPPVLILDDVLSAVDTATEERILSGLREVTRDRTTLIVSHRISTVKNADTVCVLENGRIVERGSHEELVSRGGLYASLHDKQLLEEELERI
jgi:ATP-binding cassette subfamily B protein